MSLELDELYGDLTSVEEIHIPFDFDNMLNFEDPNERRETTKELIKVLAKSLVKHPIFCERIFEVDFNPSLEIDEMFESFLTSYIMKKVNKIDVYLITSSDIAFALNELYVEVFKWGYHMFRDENSVECMLDYYPLKIISDICGVSTFYANILGDSVKAIIGLRSHYPNFLPKELYNVIDTNTPLVGDSKSPLTQHELNALHRYLGSKKSIYVQLLLGSGFELSQHRYMLDYDYLSLDDILTLSNSSWLFLFLMGAVYNKGVKDGNV